MTLHGCEVALQEPHRYIQCPAMTILKHAIEKFGMEVGNGFSRIA
jgi:hypothetical protein